MREPQYSILADIQDAIERAKQGKLALYWQRTIQRESAMKFLEQAAMCRTLHGSAPTLPATIPKAS